MGERKVLNKYYPPDFDPSKLPKGPARPTQYVVRLMAPFTMRCLTCGNYVYKGKKFNSRKEDSAGEKYLGIQIYRFYIRCPECLSEITFKTNPENADYAVEHGAIRTFQAERLAELEEQKEIEEKEEEEARSEAPPTKLARVDDDRSSKQVPSKLKLAGLVRRKGKEEASKSRDSDPTTSCREGGEGGQVDSGHSSEPAGSSLGLLCAYSSSEGEEEEEEKEEEEGEEEEEEEEERGKECGTH